MTTPQRPTGPSMQIPEGLNIAYSNLARISHSPADIVIDFAHFLPAENQARVCSRVVMTPLSAKLLLRALTENLARYEATFGEINIPNGSNTLAENLFRPFQPPEGPDHN